MDCLVVGEGGTAEPAPARRGGAPWGAPWKMNAECCFTTASPFERWSAHTAKGSRDRAAGDGNLPIHTGGLHWPVCCWSPDTTDALPALWLAPPCIPGPCGRCRVPGNAR